MGNVETGLAETRARDERARFLEEILEDVRANLVEVRQVREEGMLPLVLGGDHSIAIGTLSGLAGDGPGGFSGWMPTETRNTPATTRAATCTGCRPRRRCLCGESLPRPG